MSGEAHADSGVEGQLDALEARGARGYDAPACDCVRALLTRAEELGGGVGHRLRERAAAHLSSLEQRFERDQRRIAEAVVRSEQQHGAQPELHKRLARGELALVGRKVRRLRALPVSVRRRPLPTPDAALPAVDTERAPDALRERRRRVVAYEDSVAQLVAAFALARATDVVPSDAGPYNPLRIASELLDRMRTVSPLYLAVQLNRLEELGSLLGLPELPNRTQEKPRSLQKPAPKNAVRKPTRRGS
ncbi:MAG TPA: DUF2894 domain-containing protein [Polyangiales bacterium]